MSKINYPESEGLKSVLRVPINDVNSSLNNAKASCSFNIPSEFGYRDYLLNLYNVISDYQSKATGIYNTACNVDNNFKFAFESMSAANSELDLVIIDQRDRLVK